MRREYPVAPIVAVGAVVLDEDGRVLLIRRAQEPQRGQWSLPGGAVELGETFAEATCREVLEETGLNVRWVETIEVLDRILLDDMEAVRYHYLLVDSLCKVVGGCLLCGSDAAEARWIGSKQALGADLALTKELKRVISRGYAMSEWVDRSVASQTRDEDSAG